MNRTPGTTPAERAKYWTRIILAARRHAFGVTAYLRDNDYEKNNYYQWFRKLRKVHPEWEDLSGNSGRVLMMEKKRRQPLNTEVVPKASRRKFSEAEKIRILAEVDVAPTGQVAAILRREGLYASHLRKWRTERDAGSLAGKKRGPKSNPDADEIRKLKLQLAKTEKKLAQANAVIELQKKIEQILKSSLSED